MRLIVKGETPEIILEKQKIANERGLDSNKAYNLLNHEEKQIVLQSLMKEQGHLCAYCLRRIPDEREIPEEIDPVTIEHWLPRSTSNHKEVGQGLDYNNMFAVCSGNRGKRHTRKTRDFTCDAKRKGSYKQLKLNPCDPTTLELIKYQEDGIMYSLDEDVQDDIEVKLNLNCISAAVQLPESRRKVLEALQAEIPDKYDEAVSFCKQALDMYEGEIDPKTEYSGILISWLKEFVSE